MPTKYRKKPVEVEAIQLTDDNGHSIINWMLNSTPRCAAIFHDDLVSLDIPTLEGRHKADVGDWIIRGVAGEFYPRKPYIFEQTYEEVIDRAEGL